jgi:hypothetical protein
VTDDGIGRLLVASLHQAVGDVLPQRLDYYEHWLSPMGLRENRSGLAPLNAVLSFLRQEGDGPYRAVMTAAGRYSAEWYFAQGAVALGRRRLLPRGMRRRLVLRRGRALLREAFQSHRVTTSVRRGAGRVTIDASVFCTLREAWPWPTCPYLASAVEHWLALHGLTAVVEVDGCRAQGQPQCTLAIRFDPPVAVAPAEAS